MWQTVKPCAYNDSLTKSKSLQYVCALGQTETESIHAKPNWRKDEACLEENEVDANDHWGDAVYKPTIIWHPDRSALGCQ